MKMAQISIKNSISDSFLKQGAIFIKRWRDNEVFFLLNEKNIIQKILKT